MATLARAPVFQTQQPRRLTSPGLVPNLAVTTLAVAAATMPFQTASEFPSQVQHRSLTLNANTSQGTPKTLFADAVKPSFDAPHLAPLHPRRAGHLNSDTTADTPKTLFSDAVKPGFNPPHFSPDRRRNLPADTTADSPLTLLVVPVAAPFEPTVYLSPVWRKFLNADTSADTPKTLFDDEFVAVFDGPHLAPQHRGKRNLINADTTADTPLTLLSAGQVQAPLVNAPTFSVDLKRIGRDTSAGTPKTLTADAVMPAVNPQHTAPDRRRWLPADTTADVPTAVLTSIVPAPIVNPPGFRVETRRHVTDTSQATAKALFADAVKPIAPPPNLGPAWRKWLPANTGAGMPYPVRNTFTVAPFVPPVSYGPAWRKWLPNDTSATVLPLITPAAPPVVQGFTADSRRRLSKKSRRRRLSGTVTP